MSCCKTYLRCIIRCCCVYPSIAIVFLSILVGVVYRLETSVRFEIPDALDGRTVLITGSSRGIGLHTAVEFCRLGAHVLVHGSDSQRTESAATWLRDSSCIGTGRATAIAFDLTDFDAVRQAATKIASRFSLLDVVILNASPGGAAQGVAQSGHHKIYATELGHFLLFEMLQQRLAAGARIVFQTSNPSWHVNYNMLTPSEPLPANPVDWYGIAKLADICFAEGLKRKLAGNASVSVVSPGSVYTKAWGGAEEILKTHHLWLWLGAPEVSGRFTLASAFAPVGFETGVVLYSYWFPAWMYRRYSSESLADWRQSPGWHHLLFGLPQIFQRFTWGSLHASVGAECSVKTQELLWSWCANATGLDQTQL